MNQLMDEVRYHGTPSGNVLTMTKKLGRPRRVDRGKRPRSLRLAYTLKAVAAMALLVGVAFSILQTRQARGLRQETIDHARSVARSLALPACDVLSRPEPMSIE